MDTLINKKTATDVSRILRLLPICNHSKLVDS